MADVATVLGVFVSAERAWLFAGDEKTLKRDKVKQVDQLCSRLDAFKALAK